MQKNNTQGKIINFPQIGQSIDKLKTKAIRLPIVSDALPLVFNNPNDEYAKSFGIQEGDTLWLDRPETAKVGDLTIVICDGVHALDTFNDDIADDSRWRVCGVLLGCFKSFQRIQEGEQQAA